MKHFPGRFVCGLAATLVLFLIGLGSALAAAPTWNIMADLQADAEKGDPEAQYLYGQALGEGSEDEAWGWYKKAAKNGHQIAKDLLAVKEGKKQDEVIFPEADARPAYQRAAQVYDQARAGDSGAQYLLGAWYEFFSDEPLAFTWYLKAAQAGVSEAYLPVALAYLHDMGADQDDAKAVEWLTKAAEAGSPEGQYTLASMYEAGRGGLVKDKGQAKAWRQKALAGGYQPAKEALGELDN